MGLDLPRGYPHPFEASIMPLFLRDSSSSDWVPIGLSPLAGGGERGEAFRSYSLGGSLNSPLSGTVYS